MKSNLNESLPALVPEYDVDIAGQRLKLRFDVNINKTKKGVKLQFVLPQVPQDQRVLQDLANEIGSELQQRFGDDNLQIVYDVENPYTNVVGFLLPLPSLAQFLMKNVIGEAGPEQDSEEKPEEEPEGEPEAEKLPPTEQGPGEEDDIVKEIFMRRAGIR